jgi:hypothetical protein
MQDNANKNQIVQGRQSPENVLPLPKSQHTEQNKPLVNVPPTVDNKPLANVPPQADNKPLVNVPPQVDNKPLVNVPPQLDNKPLINVPPDIKNEPLIRSNPSGLTPDQLERLKQSDKPIEKDLQSLDRALIVIGVVAAAVLAAVVTGGASLSPGGSMQTSPAGAPIFGARPRYDY